MTTYAILNAAGGVHQEIDVPDGCEVSDGFHTFDELYEHRMALSAVLATIAAIDGESWKSKLHHPEDGPMFEGYFVVGIELPCGTITYHYELTHWDVFNAVQELEHAPKWDGHTPSETVGRLLHFRAMLAAAVAMVEVREAAAGTAWDESPNGTNDQGNADIPASDGGVTTGSAPSYQPVQVPENTGQHPAESGETTTNQVTNG